MGTRIIAGLALIALAGCSTVGKVFTDVGNAQQNPAVQGQIDVASQKQCEQFAKDQPDAAKTTAQYLSTVAGATEACIDGINAGLVPVN